MHINLNFPLRSANFEGGFLLCRFNYSRPYGHLPPDGAPEHKIRFWHENGVLKGSYITEHKEQEMRELTRSGCDISFKADAGSHGDEVFYTRLRRFQGGIMLGTTLQLRNDDVCAPSHVLCVSTEPNWEMKR